jgi:hypothetical protein
MSNFIKTYNKTEFTGKNGVYSSDCIAIQFYIPSGANPAFINGILLPAGSTYEIQLDHPYIDSTQYEVNFSTGGSGNQLFITRIFVK